MKKIFALASFVLIVFTATLLPTETVNAVARDTFPSSHRLQPLPENTQPNISSNVQSVGQDIAPGLVVEEPSTPENTPQENAPVATKSSHAWILYTLGTLGIVGIIYAVAKKNEE